MNNTTCPFGCEDCIMNNTTCSIGCEDDLRSRPLYVTMVLGTSILVATLGNGLLLLVHLYEKYGIDSLKRTVVNQLISQACFWMIYANTTTIPIFAFCLTQPGLGYVSHLLGQFAVFSMSATYIICGVCLAEAMILKCLYTFKFSVISLVDEYFMARFFGRFNVFLFASWGLIRLYLGSLASNFHVGYLSKHPLEAPSDLASTVIICTVDVPLVLIVTTVIASYVAIAFKKRRSNHGHNVQAGGYNNSGKNESIISSSAILFCTVVFLFIATTKVLQRAGYCLGETITALDYLLAFALPSPLLTVVFFASKPARFKIAVENLPCFN